MVAVRLVTLEVLRPLLDNGNVRRHLDWKLLRSKVSDVTSRRRFEDLEGRDTGRFFEFRNRGKAHNNRRGGSHNRRSQGQHSARRRRRRWRTHLIA